MVGAGSESQVVLSLRPQGRGLETTAARRAGVLRHSHHNERSTQNWSGQGESDSLIKTKHCDGLKRC